jgi:5-oxoprolinase (ATP-hydrolysing)
MPADSRHIDEEGVLIRGTGWSPRALRRGARARAAEAGAGRRATRSRTSPTCAPSSPPTAAAWHELERPDGRVRARGRAGLHGHIQRNAAAAVRERSPLPDGSSTLAMDGGETVRVAMSVDREARGGDRFHRHLAAVGGQPQRPRGDLPRRRAVRFRCLVDRDIPLNEGCLAPLELCIPEGSLLNPRWPAAVAGGNVETSQCVVDALFGALGVVAASQGTMNNLSFGNAATSTTRPCAAAPARARISTAPRRCTPT